MAEIAYLNGAYLPLQDAVIPIEDRGFQFADGIYEVIRIYNTIPFCLTEHLKRLERSAAGILMALPLTIAEFRDICDEVIKRSGLSEAWIYIQVTRGVYPRRHNFPPDSVLPTVIVYIREFKEHPAEWRQQGVDVITIPDIRWKRCDIKSISLLPNVLAKEQAVRAGAFEAIQINDDGFVTEGSSTNVFFIKKNILYTYPVGDGILSGITRNVIFSIATKAGLTIREEAHPLKDYLNAEEVFISSTTIEIVPVRSIDKTPINNGKIPGSYTMRMHQLYREEVDRVCS